MHYDIWKGELIIWYALWYLERRVNSINRNVFDQKRHHHYRNTERAVRLR